jgi:hypothetical protein
MQIRETLDHRDAVLADEEAMFRLHRSSLHSSALAEM